jgi:hypothetical protein
MDNDVRAERFVAYTAASRLTGDPSWRRVGLRMADVRKFGFGRRCLDAAAARRWVAEWKTSLRERGRGRLRTHCDTVPGKAGHDHEPMFDIPGGVRLLTGSPVHQITVLSLSGLSEIRRIMVGPGGDWVSFPGDSGLPDDMADSAERLWVAGGKSKLAIFWDDEDGDIDRLADGWRPGDQAALQMEIDAGKDGEPRIWPCAPTPGVLKRAMAMAFHDTRLTADDLMAEPGSYPGALYSAAIDVLLGGGALFERCPSGSLRLLPGMACSEALEIVDGLIGTNWLLAVMPAASRQSVPDVIICNPGGWVESVRLQPDRGGQQQVARFDRVPGIPVLRGAAVRAVLHGESLTPGKLRPFSAPREAVLAAVARAEGRAA